MLYVRCACGRIYNALAETLWQGTHHSGGVIVRILQGFAKGTPTLHLAHESGQIQLILKKNSARQDLEPSVLAATHKEATVNTDEWGAYQRLSEAQRKHLSVCHTPGKCVWARDDNGDGIREVHVNTIEGLWTGLRNFLRPFRGVNKVYLQQYLAVHEWVHDLKELTMGFLRILCGVTQIAS